MMRYQYKCDSCGVMWEEDRSMDQRDADLDGSCQECGREGQLRRVYTPVKFKLKGYGWASDGYATHVGDHPDFKTGNFKPPTEDD